MPCIQAAEQAAHPKRGQRTQPGVQDRGWVLRGHACKEEAPSGKAAPLSDPALKRPELAVGEPTRIVVAESREESLRGAVRLVLEPRDDVRRRIIKRIDSRSPAPRRFGSRATGGSYLAVAPRVRGTLQEAIEISISTQQDLERLAGG